MKKIVFCLLASSMMIGLIGCNENAQYTTTPVPQGGNIVGGILGGVSAADVTYAGSVAAVRQGGVSFGYYINNRFKNSLDRPSLIQIDEAGQYAMQSGQTTFWRTVRTTGRFYPHQAFTLYDGHVCRRFIVWLGMGIKYDTFGGSACRNDRGVWVVQ